MIASPTPGDDENFFFVSTIINVKCFPKKKQNFFINSGKSSNSVQPVKGLAGKSPDSEVITPSKYLTLINPTP
jgi:hypothetical protein